MAALLLVGALLLAPPLHAQPEVGKAAPTFALRDRQGTLVSLSDLCYPGEVKAGRPKQVVLLDFFRTDCKPCIKGLPELVKLHAKLKQKAARVLLVTLLEEDEGEEKLERFLADHPLPFPVLVDAYAVAAKKYVQGKKGVQIPAQFLLDREGVLRASTRKVDAKLQERIEALLR